MNIPILQQLQNVRDRIVRSALYAVIKPMKERYRSCAHSSAGLVIKAGGSALAKTGASVFHYQAKGKNGSIAASTDMPALSGTVTNAKFNVFVFTVDDAGTTYCQMGTEGATQAAVKWPALNTERAIIGYIKINPTGTGDFVGGTTALDDATVAPNAAYVNPIGVFDPTARID